MLFRKLLGIGLTLCAVVTAQTPAFEVASIRLAEDDGGHDSDADRGIFRTHNLSLKRLIAAAYDVDESQVIGGPKWIDLDGWDINAKIPAEFSRATTEQISQMTGSLLEERFALRIHREPRQVAGYALTIAAGGLKINSAKESESGSEFNTHNSHLTARYVTMDQLARRLSRNKDIGKPVFNTTGLTADRHFDFELEWAPEQADGKADSDKPTIFAALQEQLGLRLSATRVTVQAVVIDRVERPKSN